MTTAEREERALVLRDDLVPDFAISPEEAATRIRKLQEFVHGQMREDSDFGVIPGTNKPTLLKPGAEKLCNLFGLSIEQEVTQRIERWEDPGFFAYEVKVTLRSKRSGFIEAEGFGSCNSKESRYRYRKSERECPACGTANIIKGKAEYGGGWLCFAKKGGCGAKFQDGDPAIEEQIVGRVENPDIYDQVNTLLKMAAKRALVDATLKAVRASDLFTQDMEDMPRDEPPHDAERPRTPRQNQHTANGSGQRQQATPAPSQTPSGGGSRRPEWADALKAELEAATLSLAHLEPVLGWEPSNGSIQMWFDNNPGKTPKDLVSEAVAEWDARAQATGAAGEADVAEGEFTDPDDLPE